MAKKVDLNTRRNNSNFRKSTHNINYYNNNYTNFSPNGQSAEYNENIRRNNSNIYNRSEYDLPKNANLTIKIPNEVKIVIVAAIIIGIPFIFLMFFTVIFSTDFTLYSSRYKFGQTCAKVTVTDTENYIYDGEVSFDDYIAGVVAAESQGSHNLEYLKLLSILARTYFLENVNSNCKVKGNSDFQQYKDIDDVNNRHVINKAIQETKDFIITDNNRLNSINYNAGCVLKNENNSYTIRYGKNTGYVKFQQIDKTWAEKIGINEDLESLYLITKETIKEMEKEFYRIEQEKKDEDPNYEIKKFVVDYNTLPCPGKTTDDGISKIGALYLIDSKYYEYEKVIKYYTERKFQIIENEIIHKGTKTGNGQYINPTGNIYCTSPYGHRTHPVKGESSFHTGIDIGIAGGSPIYAAKDGTVKRIEKNVKAINNCDYGYGNYVVIDHGDGTSTLYAHMKYGSISDSLSKGSSITQGEQIGQVGSTGCSTGNHLHYEVEVNGSTVDPADYLDLTNASGTCKR